MKNTREKILNTLLSNHQATTQELARVVGINGISVRHHLINLEAEGLVAPEEERHGVGRPRFVYHLTQKGLEHFPTNYLRLTDHLVDSLEEILSKEQLAKIYENMGNRMASLYKVSESDQGLEGQLQELSDQLTPDGYRLSWDHKGEETILYNRNCPYRHIGLRHPQICSIDQAMFNTLLKKPVKADECIFTGSDYCSYRIKID